MHGHWLKGYLREGKEIEGGGGSGGDSGVMFVTMSGENGTLDKTFGEIKAALEAGKYVSIVGFPYSGPTGGVTSAHAVNVYEGPGGLAVTLIYDDGEKTSSANENATLSDYPIFDPEK